MPSLTMRLFCRPTSVSRWPVNFWRVSNWSQPGAEAAWEAEIARRIARYKAGESKPIPAGEVFVRLRQVVPDR